MVDISTMTLLQQRQNISDISILHSICFVLTITQVMLESCVIDGGDNYVNVIRNYSWFYKLFNSFCIICYVMS